jgi:hypothetical protein
MFSPDGAPLPPTKQQETGEQEREARKKAIACTHRGSIAHALVKTSLLLETRTVSWKRIGELSTLQQRPVPASLDASSVDPWKIALMYGRDDAETLDMAQRRVKKVFELARSKTIGTCDRCHGARLEKCRACHASPPDACFWCKDTSGGSKSTCKQCSGSRVLVCRTCDGAQSTPCRSCHGEGKGLFSAFVQVTMTKIDMEIVPLASIIPQAEALYRPQIVASTCTQRARQVASEYMSSTVQQLPSSTREGRTHRSHRARKVYCSLHNSRSHLIELEVPREARVVAKKSTTPFLRPGNLFQRKIPYSSFYFILPSDPDLCAAELSRGELDGTVKAQEERDQLRRSRQSSPSNVPAMGPIEQALHQKLNPPIQPLELPSLSSTPSTISLSASLKQIQTIT